MGMIFLTRKKTFTTEYKDLERNGFCEALDALNIPYTLNDESVLFFLDLMCYSQLIDALCQKLGTSREEFNKVGCC